MQVRALVGGACAMIVLGSCNQTSSDPTMSKAEPTANARNDCNDVKISNWRAWIDTLPISGTSTLHVIGTTKRHGAGWTAVLVNKGLDTSRPPTQMFELVVHAPTSRLGKVINTLEARRDIAGAKSHYKAVDILCDRVTIAHLPVAEMAGK